MAEGREDRRRRRTSRPGEVDLFASLIDVLADELCALPADAWEEGDRAGGAVASLAERLAALAAVREDLTEEEEHGG